MVRLANTVPKGMNDLPEHLEIRRKLEDTQSSMDILNSSSPVNSKNVDDLQNIVLSNIHKLDTSRFNAERIGFTQIDNEYLYKHNQLPENHETVIIIMYQMDYDEMITAPSLRSSTEILKSYYILGEAVKEMTKLLIEIGLSAKGHHPLGNSNQHHDMLLPPHAVNAGLGEKGRTGLFIDYELGPHVRLGGISTDIEVDAITFPKRGITEFCHRCRYCVRYCPPSAIPNDKYIDQLVSETEYDFKINAERCFAYFENHGGCGKCIVNCVLAEPDNDDITRRVKRIENWYNKWIVSGELEKMYKEEINATPKY